MLHFLATLVSLLYSSFAMDQAPQTGPKYPWNLEVLLGSDLFNCDPYLHLEYEDIMAIAQTSRAARNGKQQMLMPRQANNLLYKFRLKNCLSDLSCFIMEMMETFDLFPPMGDQMTEGYKELAQCLSPKHLSILRPGLMNFFRNCIRPKLMVVSKDNYEPYPFLVQLVTLGKLATAEDPLRIAIRGGAYAKIRSLLLNGNFDLSNPGVQYDLETYGDAISQKLCTYQLDSLTDLVLPEETEPSYTFMNIINGQMSDLNVAGFALDRSVNAMSAKDFLKILKNFYYQLTREEGITMQCDRILNGPLELMRCVVLEDVPALMPFKDLHWAIFRSMIFKNDLPEDILPCAHALFAEMVLSEGVADCGEIEENDLDILKEDVACRSVDYFLNMSFVQMAELINMQFDNLLEASILMPADIKLEVIENLIQNGLHFNSTINLGKDSWIDTIARLIAGPPSGQNDADVPPDNNGLPLPSPTVLKLKAIRCCEAFLTKGLDPRNVFSKVGKRLMKECRCKEEFFRIAQLIFAPQYDVILPDIKGIIVEFLIEVFLLSLSLSLVQEIDE